MSNIFFKFADFKSFDILYYIFLLLSSVTMTTVEQQFKVLLLKIMRSDPKAPEQLLNRRHDSRLKLRV